MSTTLAPVDSERRDAFAGRLFESMIGAFDLLSVYLGDRLGLYHALADGGPATAPELASRAGIDRRYALEWLEQQAVTGILEVDDAELPADERRFALPAAHAEVLLDPISPALAAPTARFLVGSARALPQLLEAYQTGGGVAWDAYGVDVVEAQAAINRPLFEHVLAQDWIPALDDINARLQAPGSRVADVGCGHGWSTLAIAQAYPHAAVDGLDLDQGSIAAANANLADVDVGIRDRVTFAARDASDPALAGRYDLVTIIEALHDMSQPVPVLVAARRLLAPGGAVLVVDERVAERFHAPGDDLERMMYAYSVLMCLANGLADSPSVATGTVIRPDTVRRYATEAGFSSVTVLPVEHETFRLYRLDP